LLFSFFFYYLPHYIIAFLYFRTHQIRVHLKERHTPVLGDPVYGNIEWNKKYLRSAQIRRPLLHSYEMEFIHPFTGQKMRFVAPLTEDFSRLIVSIQRSMLLPEKELVFDEKTSLLKCGTEVAGRQATNTVVFRGGTPILTTIPKKYVPMDRLKVEEDEDEDLLLDHLMEKPDPSYYDDEDLSRRK
jgi:hypothetical protein